MSDFVPIGLWLVYIALLVRDGIAWRRETRILNDRLWRFRMCDKCHAAWLEDRREGGR